MSDFMAKISAAALETQAEMKRGNSAQRARDYSERSMFNGWEEYIIDLATLSSARLYSIQGRQLIAAVIGSAPGALNVYFNNAATPNLLAPGTQYRGPFTQFTLERRNDSPVSGILRLMVNSDENVSYSESPAFNNSAGIQSVQCQLSTASPLQAYNAAKFSNAPTGMTAVERELYCIDASKSSFIRIMASCVGAPLITAGTALLWVFDPVANNWFASSIEIPLQTGHGRVASGDYEMGVKTGLVFAEVYGLTNAALTGNITVLARAS